MKFLGWMLLFLAAIGSGFWMASRYYGADAAAGPAAGDAGGGTQQDSGAEPVWSPTVYQDGRAGGAVRDSLSNQLYSQRSNAITRVVADASPAVVGINVTEVREYNADG